MQGEKSTSAVFIKTRPNFNIICGHILGLYPCNAERFDPAVVENDSKSPSVGVLMPMGWGEKTNFCNSDPITLKLE
jgi:hypothetical protein